MRDGTSDTVAAISEKSLFNDDHSGIGGHSSRKSRKKRSTGCQVEHKTRVLTHSFQTMNRKSRVVAEVICNSSDCSKQHFDLVDGCYQLPSKSKKCADGIKIKIPVRSRCECLTKSSAGCEKPITRHLHGSLTTMSGNSVVTEGVCKSYGKQHFGIVHGCYKTNSDVIYDVVNKGCVNGIKVKIPVRRKCT